MQELYSLRKETIESLFGTTKENHGFRYTQLIRKARMEMKVGLTFACMNLKKLARMMERKGLLRGYSMSDIQKTIAYFKSQNKMALGLAS